jgi:hypothetical protein
LDINLHSKRVNDYSIAHDTISDISKDELIIRDLGYVSIDLLKKIDNVGAFFLNRIKPQTIIFEKVKGKYVRISIKAIIKHLRKTGEQYVERDLYIGDKKFFPCRVIFILVPDDKLKERKKRQLGKSRRRGAKIDPKVLDAIELNIFITNSPKEHLPAGEVHNVYRLRWQIELVFKTWKQICRINDIKQAKTIRIEAMIYAQLLWISLNWSIISAFLAIHFRLGNGLLSIYKAFKTLRLMGNILKNAIRESSKLERFIGKVGDTLSKNHFKEKRKGRTYSVEILKNFQG